mgnify:CR=1 FL=1
MAFAPEGGDKLNILYSTGCPRCKQLVKMLDKHNINYTTITDTDQMLREGLTEVPVLEVGGIRLGYQEAMDWLMQKENNNK